MYIEQRLLVSLFFSTTLKQHVGSNMELIITRVILKGVIKTKKYIHGHTEILLTNRQI